MSDVNRDEELTAFVQATQPALDERLKGALRKRPMSEAELIEELDARPS